MGCMRSSSRKRPLAVASMNVWTPPVGTSIHCQRWSQNEWNCRTLDGAEQTQQRAAYMASERSVACSHSHSTERKRVAREWELTVLASPVRVFLGCRRQRFKQTKAVQLLVQLRQQLLNRWQTEQPLLWMTSEVIVAPLRIIVHVAHTLVLTVVRLLLRTVSIGLAFLSSVSLLSVALLLCECALFVLLSGVGDVPVAQTIEADRLLIVHS